METIWNLVWKRNHRCNVRFGLTVFVHVVLDGIVQAVKPRCVVNWCHCASHDGSMGLVAESHDVLMLVVFPFKEGLHNTLDVEHGVVSLLNESTDVVRLKANVGFISCLNLLLSSTICCPLFFHAGPLRHRDTSKDDISSIPGLCIKHVEGQPLVLHAQVEQLRILLPHHSLMKGVRNEAIFSLKPQVRTHERETVLVACAEDDGIDIGAATILEVASAAFHVLQ
mmetsp:Transcript_654/g.1067  ORF Transcript_654/g.1067 Transcript_654/m.1067 type:complete len:225 (+) Transcript_654:1121-1795(+)